MSEYRKPSSLKTLAPHVADVFAVLRKNFSGLRETWTFDISTIIVAPDVLTDRLGTAAFALRRLQALYMASQTDLPVDTRWVIATVSEVNAFLEQVRQHETDLSTEDSALIRSFSQQLATIMTDTFKLTGGNNGQFI
jgi:hypothetical protein